MHPDPDGNHRRLDIQGLRAIAVLLVVAFHAGLGVPGGFVGVDVFFVISGFVITAMLEREWNATGRLNFGRFYLRRFKRLTPALAIMVAVTVAASAALLSPLGRQQIAAKTAIGVMLLGANMVIARTTGGYFDAPAETNPLLNTWSLSVEEQFYLAFPLILALGWALARRTRTVVFSPLIIVGLIALGSFALAVTGSAGHLLSWGSWLVGFYSPFTRAWEFGAGALLSLGIRRLTISSSAVTGGAGSVGIAALLSSLWLITGSSRLLGMWTLLPVAGTALLIWSGNNASNFVSRALSISPMVAIGDWSYSIYLWHWPFIVFAGLLWPGSVTALVVAAAVSFAPAVGSYVLVEQPMRRMAIGDRRRFSRIILATVIPPIALAATLEMSARAGWWSPTIKVAVDDLTTRHGEARGECITRGPYTPESLAKCEWNSAASGEPVYLIGDSNAWQFVEAVTRAGELLNRPVWVFTAPSCAPIRLLRFAFVAKSEYLPPAVSRPNAFDHCPAYVNFITQWLRHSRRGVVFIAELDQYWWDVSVGAGRSGENPVSDVAGKSALLQEGLESTIRELQQSGHHVVIVQSLPNYRNPAPIWDPADCSTLALLQSNCYRSVPSDFIRKLQLSSREAISRAADATGSNVLDLRNSFCDRRTCSTNKDGAMRYLDAVHITVSASRNLAPEFVGAVNAADRSR